MTTLLLSPADLRGRRAAMLLRDGATFPLAVALREGRASLGEVFAFVSKLYFRGKLGAHRKTTAPLRATMHPRWQRCPPRQDTALDCVGRLALAAPPRPRAGSLVLRRALSYAQRFGGVVRVIVPGRGLLDPALRVTTDHLHAFSQVGVDPELDAFRGPLLRHTQALAAVVEGPVVLLGSIATAKYVEPLTAVLGDRLAAPSAFVGRGDMSRGALLLRAAASGQELDYVPVASIQARAR